MKHLIEVMFADAIPNFKINYNSDILAQKGFLKSQRIALLEMMMGFPIGHTELAQ